MAWAAGTIKNPRAALLTQLRRYAEAHKELSWAGGKYGADEYDNAIAWLKRERRRARRRILEIAGL